MRWKHMAGLSNLLKQVFYQEHHSLYDKMPRSRGYGYATHSLVARCFERLADGVQHSISLNVYV